MTHNGTIHRYMEVTPTNHQPWLYVATLLSMMYAFSVLGIRIFVKFGQYALDDLVLVGGYIFGIAQWALTLSALELGLGKALWLVPDASGIHAAKVIFSGRVTLHLLLAMVKISCLCLVRNVFTVDNRKAWMICNILICICAACCVAACFVATVGCHPSTTLLAVHNATCTHMQERATALCVMEFSTQLFCGLIPTYLFLDIQMSTARRIVVCSAFIFPIFNGVLFVAHLHFYARFINSGPDHSNIGLVDPLIIQQALVSYALVSATVPCLKGFAARFATGGIHDVILHDQTPRDSPPSSRAGKVSNRSSAERGLCGGVEMMVLSNTVEEPPTQLPGALEHKISSSKLRDPAEPLGSTQLLPHSVHNTRRSSPAFSISSTTALALKFTSPRSNTQSAKTTLEAIPVHESPSTPKASTPSKGKAKASTIPDWTTLNNYDSPNRYSTTPTPIHNDLSTSNRKPSQTPYSINTTPPLAHPSSPRQPPPNPSIKSTIHPNSSYIPHLPCPSPPTSTASNSSFPPAPPPTWIVPRHPSATHADQFTAHRSLSLRPDLDTALGLGGYATAEATPVDERRGSQISWPSPVSMKSPGGSPGLDDGRAGGEGHGRREIAEGVGVVARHGERREMGEVSANDVCGYDHGSIGDPPNETWRGKDRGEGGQRETVVSRKAEELIGREQELLDDAGASTAHAGLAVGAADARTGDRIEAEDTQDRPSSSRSENARNAEKKEERPKVKRGRNGSIFVTKEVKLESCDVAAPDTIGN
ncbi:hypothetical protein B9Z65_2640 [Elsinoe australis]|uniref:Rhodopsin domain-containing protein n=1 Tax=Elsinoe australis TaxID=40998 RepID=A0A2P8A462_9PEZI|nr:hypothetical protein B9Z65_2640 [Elsinoe australis]